MDPEDASNHQYCCHLLGQLGALLVQQIFASHNLIRTDIELSAQSAKNHVETIRGYAVYHRKYHEAPAFIEQIALSEDLQATFDKLSECYETIRNGVCEKLEALVAPATQEEKKKILRDISAVHKECLSITAKHRKQSEMIKKPSFEGVNVSVTQHQNNIYSGNHSTTDLLKVPDNDDQFAAREKRAAACKEVETAMALAEKEDGKGEGRNKIADKIKVLAECDETKPITDLVLHYLKHR